MKIVLSAQGANLDSPFEPRFGRCEYFIFIDRDTRQWQAEPNPASGGSGGAGTQAAQFVVSNGAQVVISGRFGPHAYSALQAAGVELYACDQGCVSEALDSYMKGDLNPVTVASAPGHSRRR